MSGAPPIDDTLDEREKSYGDYSGVSWLSQSLKYLVRTHPTWDYAAAPLQESVEMILHKIARIVNGNAYHEDSWVDIIGYATLAVRHIKRETYNDYEHVSESGNQSGAQLRASAQAVQPDRTESGRR